MKSCKNINLATTEQHKCMQVSPAWEFLMFFAKFRFEYPVTEIMIFQSAQGKTGYYVCPRCRMTLEREFMNYCDRCGQRLGWKDYKKSQENLSGKFVDMTKTK